MDSKEIKSLLKQARQAIDAKDFQAANKHCQAVLRADNHNYNAWVFLAVAIQGSGQFQQAETAFNRAIEICPAQLLAWQGLATLYDKPGQEIKYADVLMKILRLLTDNKEKQSEIIEKLTILSKSIEDKLKVIEILKVQLEFENESEKLYKFWYQLFTELSVDQILSAGFEKLQHAALANVVESPFFTDDDCKEVVSIFIHPEYKRTFSKESTELMRRICLKFQHVDNCLLVLLKKGVDCYITSGVVDENLKEIVHNACAMKVNKCVQFLCKQGQAILSFTAKQYMDAIGFLNETCKKNIESWFLLSKMQLKLHMYRDAETSAKAGLRLAMVPPASPFIIGHLYLFLGKALCGKNCWDSSLKAIEKSIEYLGKTPDILAAKCHTFLEMEFVDEAEKMFSDFSSGFSSYRPLHLQLSGYLHLLKKEYSKALPKLKESIEDISVEESAFSTHLLGRVFWEMGEQEKAAETLFKAVKLDPFYKTNFLYLGQYYMLHEHNARSARRCYQRAFDLDNSDTETARYLVNILRVLRDNEARFAVLKHITETAPLASCKWAWIPLGLYQLEKNLIHDAVFSFQKLTSIDPLNSYGRQCLADAYLKRGSYEAALNSYEDALELGSKPLYPLYKIGTIQMQRHLFIEAIEKFEEVLNLDSTFVPGLIGLAETYLRFGKFHFSNYRYGKTRDCFQQTLITLSRVAAIDGKILCLWTLAGEVCTFCFHLGENWFPLVIPAELHLPSQRESIECTKTAILSFGSKFYMKASLLEDRLSFIWYNLGISWYFQFLMCQSEENNLIKARLCLQKASFLSRNNHRYWHMLGVIAITKNIPDYALGQHAIIKCIQLTKNRAKAWTSLGALYLEKDEIQLANTCFGHAQSSDFRFPSSWIGQAMISERVNCAETVALYRYATTIKPHPAALFEYGRITCMTLLDQSNHGTQLSECYNETLDAINIASDCMQKYTANNIDCPNAYIFLGILFERKGANDLSLKAFERAVHLLSKMEKSGDMEKARTNYARLLSKVGRHGDAIVEYLKSKDEVDIFLLCNFAFALFKNNSFGESFKMFNDALNMCSSPGDKSHVLVAMAFVALRSFGLAEALQLLEKSFETKPASPVGLLALCAISVIKRNSLLTSTIQQELHPLKNDRKYSPSIALLSAIETYNKGDTFSARNILIRAVLEQPDNSMIWMNLASSLFQWNSSPRLVDICVQIANCHDRNKEVASQLCMLSKLGSGCRAMTFLSAQEALYVHPENLSNWIILVAACHISGKNQSQLEWIFSFVKELVKRQGIEAKLLGWLTVMEIYFYISCKDYSSASGLLKQACDFSDFDSKILSILQILDAFLNVVHRGDKIDPFINALTIHSETFFGWQLLIHGLIKSEKFDEAEKVLTQFRIATSKFFPKFKLLPLLQIALLSYKAMKLTGHNDRWENVANDALTEAVKVSPNNTLIRFLQGIIAWEMGNIGFARKSLEKVVWAAMKTESLYAENYAAEILTDIYKKDSNVTALERLLNHLSQ